MRRCNCHQAGDCKKGKDSDFPPHFFIKHPAGFYIEMVQTMAIVCDVCHGPNLMQRRQNAASTQSKKEEGERDVFVLLTLVFVLEVMIYTRPSHSYKVNAASRAGRLGSFSYVFI